MSEAPDSRDPDAMRAVLRDAVRAAILAPSVHNTQPWRFRISGQTLQVHADRSRQLTTLDPTGRLLFISCGAAVTQAEVWLRGQGWSPEVRMLPDDSDDDLLATITLAGRAEPTADEQALAAAIEHRHSQREPFVHSHLSTAQVDRLRALARADGAWFRLLRNDDERLVFTSLLEQSDWLQRTDPAYREELQAWVRTEPSPDGVPTSALPVAGVRRTDLLLREFDLDSAAVARRFHAGNPPSEERAVVALLGTDADRPADWLLAGRALGRILLHLTVEGMQASVLGQVIDLARSRRLLQVCLGVRGPVHIALRIGHGPTPGPTPRRPVDEVLAIHQEA